MTQYAWQPVMKFVPTDGTEDVMVFSEVFTDTNGPKSVVASHELEQTSKEDVNRSFNSRNWGFRPRCRFEFEIIDTQTQAYFALIVNRLRVSDIWTTYLSLDGGLTYRSIELKTLTGPVAIGGKTFAGAAYTLDVHADLVDFVPNLATGVW